jgi:predicted PurR-regulated permease PerM
LPAIAVSLTDWRSSAVRCNEDASVSAVRVATCGLALQSCPTKEKLAVLPLADLRSVELAALSQVEGEVAMAWAIAATGGLGRTVVLILLTLVLVAILYSQGETAAGGVLAFSRRLGGDAGERTVRLAGQAVRSVAMGVVLTALVQSVLAGIGLWFCGIPHPALLTAVAFILGIAQIGPVPVMAASAAWLYWTGDTGWAIVLLVWSVPLLLLDNVLRPILIRRGVQLPLLLVVAGVIGGLIGFGVVGLFIGPVVLAVTYTLAKEWVAADQSQTAPK